jgi:hypothetical protein
MYTSFPTVIHAHAQFIHLHVIIVTTLGEKYKLRRSLIGPDILLSTLFSVISSLCFPLNMRGKFHFQTKPQARFQFFIYFNVHVFRYRLFNLLSFFSKK